MNANEARELTFRNSKVPRNRKAFDIVISKIEEAARSGLRHIINPFDDICGCELNFNYHETVDCLKSHGYDIQCEVNHATHCLQEKISW